MLPSLRTPVTSSPTVVCTTASEQATAGPLLVYGVVLVNTGANPASIGDHTVAAGGAFTMVAGAILAIDVPAGEVIYAASSSGTTIETLITNPRTGG